VNLELRIQLKDLVVTCKMVLRKLAQSLTTRRCLSTAFKSRQWTIGMSKRSHAFTTIKNERLLSSSAFVNDGHHHHFVSTKVLDNGAAIKVDDSVFHASWLWTTDPTHIHPTSGQRLRTPGQYPQSKIRSCQVLSACFDQLDSKDAVVPNNPPPPPGSFHSLGGVYRAPHDEDNDGHNCLLQVTWDTNEISYYDLDWLARCRYDAASLQRQHAQTKVTKGIALGAKHNKTCPQIPTFDFDATMTRDDILLQAFHGLNNQGALVIENVADGVLEDTVASLGKRFGGSLSHGALYGDIFHVQSVPNANNIAYTTAALPPHQDLTYYESKPFLQLLHCVNHTHVVGGESVLIDALAAAEEFKLLAPDLYEVLTQAEATFLKQRDGGDMVSRKPHIVCSGQDVVAVHWSPPFEGPLAIAPELVDDYFVAYSALERMLDNSVPPNLPTKLAPELDRMLRDYAHEFTWEQDLQPGQILVFNNQRMLHGRRGFRMTDDTPSSGRHLIGCYTNVDETISRYRLLLREAPDRDQHVVRNAGNGTRGSL
jgi:gamma-butyrobetaine dioxygenase